MSKTLMDADHLQLWGGIECTVNRVGDVYRDQLEESGHHTREDDIQLLSTLGISAVRYPVLWERTVTSNMLSSAPTNQLENVDWSWSDRRLSLLQQHKIEPIVGLVHHGSGPAHTNLLDTSFVSGLRDYARAVARRYPWITTYTPVNEPLTTARFSCLYGHWYPHGRSDKQFVTALLHQCLATSEAMRAIRSVNPQAKLLLTEDLAKVHSTPRLSGQAEFENHRRWLSIDLMMGRVDRNHPLWDYLARTKRLARLMDQLVDDPSPPDLLGFNYYLTSERFLDERWDQYPAWAHGGNGRQRYADIEAVRVLQQGIDGREKLLREAWRRYQLPMAVTEAHLCGTTHEQMRWLADCWQGAHTLRSEGVDLRAVTVWSLFGSYDWNSLCVCRNGHYEPGAFDLSSGTPVPTALADLVKLLAQGPSDLAHLGYAPGWWQCDSRLIYAPVTLFDSSTIPQSTTSCG